MACDDHRFDADAQILWTPSLAIMLADCARDYGQATWASLQLDVCVWTSLLADKLPEEMQKNMTQEN